MIQFHKAFSPYKYQGVFYANTSAKLPELHEAFSPYRHHGVFYANYEGLQYYQVTSHCQQEGPYQTDDASFKQKEEGGNCLIAWSVLKPWTSS